MTSAKYKLDTLCTFTDDKQRKKRVLYLGPYNARGAFEDEHIISMACHNGVYKIAVRGNQLSDGVKVSHNV